MSYSFGEYFSCVICLIISIVISLHWCHPVESVSKSIGIRVSDKPSSVTPPEIVRRRMKSIYENFTCDFVSFSLHRIVRFYAKIWLFGVWFVNIGSTLSWGCGYRGDKKCAKIRCIKWIGRVGQCYAQGSIFHIKFVHNRSAEFLLDFDDLSKFSSWWLHRAVALLIFLAVRVDQSAM